MAAGSGTDVTNGSVNEHHHRMPFEFWMALTMALTLVLGIDIDIDIGIDSERHSRICSRLQFHHHLTDDMS